VVVVIAMVAGGAEVWKLASVPVTTVGEIAELLMLKLKK
jgi:hypothetical protein